MRVLDTEGHGRHPRIRGIGRAAEPRGRLRAERVPHGATDQINILSWQQVADFVNQWRIGKWNRHKNNFRSFFMTACLRGAQSLFGSPALCDDFAIETGNPASGIR